jgi:hypothetical protein
VLRSRIKHIEVRYHFLRDNVQKGNIDLIHVPTEKQLVDILTKPLDQSTFACLRGELGVIFPFWALVERVDVHMHVAFSFMYHIMSACLHLCIRDCICIICRRDVLLPYALITMIC